MLSPFLNAISVIKNIKKQEIILPIAQRQGTITPLFVGDDLSLRTAITSPVIYDRDMIKLLYNHIDIIEPALEENVKAKKLNFEKFKTTFSNIDKSCMMWGLYKATYETMGTRKIKCEKENCDAEWDVEILLDDIMHDDSITLWDKEVPFYEYEYQINKEYEGYLYTFFVSLPSMARNNAILSSVSTEAIQYNIEKLGSSFSKTENLGLITKKLKFGLIDGAPESYVESSSLTDILIASRDYVPEIVCEHVFKEYEKEFGKFNPKFYKKMNCPVCETEVIHKIDLELSFFLRTV